MLTQKLISPGRPATLRARLFVLFLLQAFYASLPTAAQDSLLLRSYRHVQQADAWLTIGNAAALTRLSAPGIAEAELSATHQKGGFTDYYQSPTTWQIDASAESLYRLSPRTVVFGRISYNNFSGKDMTGSAFINPTRKPFDLTEDSLTNAGDKHRDTYHLTGGLGVDVWKGLSLGLSLDYTAANYAKYKDLRHQNKLMDLSLSVGAYMPVTEWLAVGAHYTYHRNTESVSFSTYGKSEKIYKTLINYGAFFGTVEQFGNEGFTDKSREMPLFEDGHGGSVQIELRPLQQLSLLGAVDFGKGSGYYGRQSPYTITYTDHDRNNTSVRAALTYTTATARHRLDVRYANEKLANRNAVYRELTNASGAYYYEYYDPVETADKQWQDSRVAYTVWLGMQGTLPTWECSVAWQWSQREQLNYLFPYFRHQRLQAHEVAVGATRHLVCRNGIWSLTLNGAYKKGSGAPYDDDVYTQPSTLSASPAVMDAFLYREYQFLTSSQYLIGGKIKYAFIFPGTRLKTHASFSMSHRKANETNEYSQGANRTEATVAIGCTF